MKKPTFKQTRLFQAKMLPRGYFTQRCCQDKSSSLHWHMARVSPERMYGELCGVEQRGAEGDQTRISKKRGAQTPGSCARSL